MEVIADYSPSTSDTSPLATSQFSTSLSRELCNAKDKLRLLRQRLHIRGTKCVGFDLDYHPEHSTDQTYPPPSEQRCEPVDNPVGASSKVEPRTSAKGGGDRGHGMLA